MNAKVQIHLSILKSVYIKMYLFFAGLVFAMYMYNLSQTICYLIYFLVIYFSNKFLNMEKVFIL